jgi:hypothetical protein
LLGLALLAPGCSRSKGNDAKTEASSLQTSAVAAQALPVSAAHLQALTVFIKHTSCEPNGCWTFACETFSDGETQGLPSHIARCRWNDKRGTGTGQNQCAYVHYSEHPDGFRNLFISARAPSDTCAPDAAFTALIKETQGYSGKPP